MTDDLIRAVIGEIEAEHGIPLALVRPLGGGSNGAWEVAAPTRRIVLKYGTNPTWMDRAARIHETSTILRAAGYPAADVHEHGALRRGGYFLLQELLPGQQLASEDDEMSPGEAALLFALLERHRQLTPPGEPWWNDYVRGAIFDAQHEWGALREHGAAEVRQLLDVVLRRVAPYERSAWRTDDFVMGDFGPHNVLVRDGQVTGVVDIEEASGRGDYVIDFARTFVRMTRPDLIEVAMPHVRDLNDRLAIAGSYWILSSLHCVAYHEPANELGEAVRRAKRRLDSLFATCEA